MVKPIADGGGQNPRRAIGGCSHHLPTRGVFFVHRHGIEAHPVVDGVRGGHVQPAFGHQRLMDALGAAAHFQPTGQDAIGLHATADAGVHHLPKPGHALVDLGAAPEFEFIGEFHLGDGEARLFCHVQHFSRRFEGVGHIGPRFGLGAPRLGHLSRRQHKAAADGVVGFLHDHVALGVGGLKDHAIGMAGQRRAIVEDQVFLRVKGQGRQARGIDLMGFFDQGKGCLGLGRVIGRRFEPGETQDGGAVSGMANPGTGQGTVQRGAQPVELEGACADAVEKPGRRHHRPHRV